MPVLYVCDTCFWLIFLLISWTACSRRQLGKSSCLSKHSFLYTVIVLASSYIPTSTTFFRPHFCELRQTQKLMTSMPYPFGISSGKTSFLLSFREFILSFILPGQAGRQDICTFIPELVAHLDYKQSWYQNEVSVTLLLSFYSIVIKTWLVFSVFTRFYLI